MAATTCIYWAANVTLQFATHRIVAVFLGLMTIWIASGEALAQPPATAPAIPTPEAIEQEVFENVQKQPIGNHTVADLNLPEKFLRGVADRVIRDSYEKRYRIVVPDTAASVPVTSRSGNTAGKAPVAVANEYSLPLAWKWIGGGVAFITAIILWRRRLRRAAA